MLAMDFGKHVSGNDAVPWAWLAKRPVWEDPEERLLWRMLENAPESELGQHFDRAENLVGNGNPRE
jgi:hypothetical protein